MIGGHLFCFCWGYVTLRGSVLTNLHGSIASSATLTSVACSKRKELLPCSLGTRADSLVVEWMEELSLQAPPGLEHCSAARPCWEEDCGREEAWTTGSARQVWILYARKPSMGKAANPSTTLTLTTDSRLLRTCATMLELLYSVGAGVGGVEGSGDGSALGCSDGRDV